MRGLPRVLSTTRRQFTACWDVGSSKHYYVNDATKATVWELPAGGRIVAVAEQMKAHRREVRELNQSAVASVEAGEMRAQLAERQLETQGAAAAASMAAQVAALQARVCVFDCERYVVLAAQSLEHEVGVANLTAEHEAAAAEMKLAHDKDKEQHTQAHDKDKEQHALLLVSQYESDVSAVKGEVKALRRNSLADAQEMSTHNSSAVDLLSKVRRASAVIVWAVLRAASARTGRRAVARAVRIWKGGITAQGAAEWRVKQLATVKQRRDQKRRALTWRRLADARARSERAHSQHARTLARRERLRRAALARWMHASLCCSTRRRLRAALVQLRLECQARSAEQRKFKAAAKRWISFGSGPRTITFDPIISFRRWRDAVADTVYCRRVLRRLTRHYKGGRLRNRFVHIRDQMHRVGRHSSRAADAAFRRTRRSNMRRGVFTAWSRLTAAARDTLERQHRGVARVARIGGAMQLRFVFTALCKQRVDAIADELRAALVAHTAMRAVVPFCQVEEVVGRVERTRRREAHRVRTESLAAQLSRALERHDSRHGVADSYHASLCEMVHDQHERVATAEAAAGREPRPIELELSTSHAFMWVLARAHGVHAPSRHDADAARARRLHERSRPKASVSAERRQIEEEVLRSVHRGRGRSRERGGAAAAVGKESKKSDVPTEPLAIWSAFQAALSSST